MKVTPHAKADERTARLLEVALHRWFADQQNLIPEVRLATVGDLERAFGALVQGDPKHLKAFRRFMDHASPTEPVGDNPYAGPDGTPAREPNAKAWLSDGVTAIETFPMECPHCGRVYWYRPSDAKDVAPPECVAAITKQRDDGGEDRATRWWKTLCASAKKAALDEQKRNAPKNEHKAIEVSARMNNALALLKVLASHQPGRDGALLEAIRNEIVAALDAPERAERGA